MTVGDKLRLHYVDHGPRDGRVVIMMHGEPSWSFLYRHMIKNVAGAGFRVLAPDLIGFGKSDKPTETSDYSYTRHMKWMTAWFKHVDVKDAVLFCQDWGGLLGLRLVAAFPDKFAGWLRPILFCRRVSVSLARPSSNGVNFPKPFRNFRSAVSCAEAQ